MSKQLVCQTLVLKLLFAWPAGSPADELKPTSPIGSGYRLTWHDEFDGDRLDTEKWTYRIDTRFWSVQRAENVSVAEGCLRLALKREKQGQFDYTAGGVISRETFQYGYDEARFRCPARRRLTHGVLDDAARLAKGGGRRSGGAGNRRVRAGTARCCRV